MTVFAVQQQMRFDANRGELVPRFPSINKAERWGMLTRPKLKWIATDAR